jgi:hypothetical protein
MMTWFQFTSPSGLPIRVRHAATTWQRPADRFHFGVGCVGLCRILADHMDHVDKRGYLLEHQRTSPNPTVAGGIKSLVGFMNAFKKI